MRDNMHLKVFLMCFQIILKMPCPGEIFTAALEFPLVTPVPTSGSALVLHLWGFTPLLDSEN